MPVCGFMGDLPADHGHCGGNVAQPGLINGERIGGQDGEAKAKDGVNQGGFDVLVALVKSGKADVKLSATYRISASRRITPTRR